VKVTKKQIVDFSTVSEKVKKLYETYEKSGVVFSRKGAYVIFDDKKGTTSITEGFVKNAILKTKVFIEQLTTDSYA